MVWIDHDLDERVGGNNLRGFSNVAPWLSAEAADRPRPGVDGDAAFAQLIALWGRGVTCLLFSYLEDNGNCRPCMTYQLTVPGAGTLEGPEPDKLITEALRRVEKRSPEMKRCGTCGKTRQLSDFPSHAGHRSGLEASCSNCAREQWRERKRKSRKTKRVSGVYSRRRGP